MSNNNMRKWIILASLFLWAPSLWAQTGWRLSSRGNWFEWIPPNGRPVRFYLAVSMVDTTRINPSVFSSKYSSNSSTWAQVANARLISWGFDAAGMYSYAFQSNTPTGGVPSVPTWPTSSDVTGTDNAPYVPVKVKIIDGTYNTSMVCHADLYANASQPDFYDPYIAQDYGQSVAQFASEYSDLLVHAIGIMVDEADNLFTVNDVSHDDGGYVIAAHVPSMSPPTGQTDHTLFAKTVGLRDWLLNDYLCTGAGTPVSTCTAPHQGTGSADPSSGSYVGASYASCALTSLNTAWGTSYTTWNTSDANGLSGIASGAYTSYGTGTGLLDENGQNLLPPRPPCNNIYPSQNWAKNTTIQNDLHSFIGAFAAQGATLMMSAWQNQFSTHPPFFYPLYDPPTWIAAAIGPVLQKATYQGGNASNVLWTAPDNLSTSDAHAIITAAPGLPIIFADYSSANNDSAVVADCPSETDPCYSTQAARASALVSAWKAVLPMQDSSGKYTVVGIEKWEYYDISGDANFGLVSDNDNPYDQSSEINGSTGNWAASHYYAAPVIIFDGTNYEALSNSLASCRSGGSIPSWATMVGSTTMDNTCIWRNEGSLPLTPEDIPMPNASTATYIDAGYGDVVSPIANFLMYLR